MTRHDTHRGRHAQLRVALDELVTDFVLHHPGEPVHALTVRRLAMWAVAQAQRPTEPPPMEARAHHNGVQFRAAPGGPRHRCVLTAEHRGGFRCAVCSGASCHGHRGGT